MNELIEDPLAVFRHGSDRLLLGEVDGQLWVSDSYWAVEVPDDDHPLAQILHRYNVTREPGVVLQIRSTLVIDPSAKHAEMAARLKPEFDRATQAVGRHRVKGEAAYIKNTDDRWLALFDMGGGMFCLVNNDLLNLVERWAPGEWFASPGLPLAALIRKVDGRPTAALMPVRHQVSEQ